MGQNNTATKDSQREHSYNGAALIRVDLTNNGECSDSVWARPPNVTDRNCFTTRNTTVNSPYGLASHQSLALTLLSGERSHPPCQPVCCATIWYLQPDARCDTWKLNTKCDDA